MNYTKGEWGLGSLDDEPFARSELSIYREDGRKIAEIMREGFLAMEEAEANAYLIAAAPDMYEALKGILEDADNGSFTTLAGSIRELAKQALAKVEGKQ